MTPDRWSEEEFLVKLQEVGAQGYHHLHPFHIRMNAGDLDRDSIRLWVANRFYYQRNIPRKDAAILANCPVREVRRKWIHRILDHDGVSAGAVQSPVASGEPSAPHALSTARGTANEGGIE